MTQLILNTQMMSLQEALKEIHFFRGVIPIKAYEFLTNHRKEAVPVLIQILKHVIQRYNHTGDYYVAHLHAMLLLGQFREKEGYPVIIELLNLPGDSIDRLIGDMLTETIPKIIVSIYNGNPEPLFALLTNQAADRFVRMVIGGCLSALIYQKMLDKETIIKRIQEIVASGKMNGDQSFFTALAELTLECKLESLYDTVRAAFKSGMVFNDYMDLHLFEKELLLPIEEITQIEYLSPLTNAAEELTNWNTYTHHTPLPVKIDRNASCPCGSGKKFKKCCISML